MHASSVQCQPTNLVEESAYERDACATHAAAHQESLGIIVPVDYLQARVAAVALTVLYNCY